MTVSTADPHRGRDALPAVREALARLRAVESAEQLLTLAPEVVCGLGFDRAIASRVEDCTWVTHAVHVAGDAEWADAIERAGRDNPQRLGPAIRESEMVRRGLPLLVTDVQHDANVHRAVADASRSRSYVAAPIVHRSHVIGFLHADRYFHDSDTDGVDRDVLALFAEGFGQALERATLAGELAGFRERARQLARSVALLGVGDDEPVAAVTVRALPAPVPGVGPLALTRRETEVVRLLARGESNARIARRLVLSEATVKSHVKHILRKLGAANRAEAVSRWLTAGGPP